MRFVCEVRVSVLCVCPGSPPAPGRPVYFISGRGAKADGPWRRAMGTGWDRETLDHDYADAQRQRRGHPVTNCQ